MPAATLMLTDDERETLRGWSRDANADPHVKLRARIVLACADGMSNVEVGAQLGLHRMTIAKWRTRFIERRLNGLRNERRSHRRPTTEQIVEVVTATIGARPPAARWSLESMAQRSGLSTWAIGRIWREYGLAPHLLPSWDNIPAREASQQVVDVAGLYLCPPQRVIVLCVDAAPVLAVDWSSPLARPRRPADRDPAQEAAIRRAITGLIGGMNIDGEAPRQARHTLQLRRFLSTLDLSVPVDLHVRVVCSGLNDPLPRSIRAWLTRHPRFHLDLLSTPAAWTIQVGQRLLLLADRATGVAAVESVLALEAEVTSWARTRITTTDPLLWIR